MSDSSALRSILTSTDMSAPGIHRAAGAMMKHYDKSAGVAVTEWRNALQTVQQPQLLPLLYVANEVLQNSKRNRGNKFLEAFSPVLGQGLVFICSRSDAETVERVRRTAKIWGDRQVYSTRFISELLHGVERYRNKDNSQSESQEDVNFSPIAQPEDKAETAAPTPVLKEDQAMSTSNTNNDESSDDDSLGFGGIGGSTRGESEGLGHLDINLTIDAKSSGLEGTGKSPPVKKRRRNSGGGTPRRKTVLSTTSLMELWTQAESLQQRMENSKSVLQMIGTSLDTENNVDQLVGDELLDQFKLVMDQLAKLERSRRSLHGIASDRYGLERQAVRYIPWLQRALVQDDEDAALCRDLAATLQELTVVHGAARAAREEKRQLEAERLARESEEARKKREEEERKRLLDAAVKTEHEAKPGQVWNKALQEYVYLNTEESWRD